MGWATRYIEKLQEGEVDQPFARIVDDVEVNAADPQHAPQRTGGRAGNRSALRVVGGRLDGMALAKHRLEELSHRAPAGKRLCALQR